jgi:hypothetical protein
MTILGRRGIALTCAALVVASAPAGARAEPAPPPAPPPPQESAPEPALADHRDLGPRRRRAALELGAVLAAAGILYLFKPSASASTGDKLDGVRLDANPWETNFEGHPLAGAFYYQVALGNRIPALESALWSVTSSAVWEVIEAHEPASLNDLIITPAAGVSLGAPLAELSLWLDSCQRGGLANALSWLTFPAGRLHARIDGAPRGHSGGGGDLAAATSAGTAFVRSAGEWRPELQLAGGWALVRGGWDEAGRGRNVLLGAHVTGLDARLSVGDAGVTDLRLSPHVLFAALVERALVDDGAGLRGRAWVAGVGLAGLYRVHDWREGGALDRLAIAELPRVAARWRTGSAAAEVDVRASVAPIFGGVTAFPLAADPSLVAPEELPTPHLRFGYHFGAGWAAEPALAARVGPVKLEVAGRADSLWGVLEPDATVGKSPSADLFDRWLEGRAALALRAFANVELRAGWEWRERRGTANGASRRSEEQVVSFALGVAR